MSKRSTGFREKKGASSTFLKEEKIPFRVLFFLVGDSILQAQRKLDLDIFNPLKRIKRYKPVLNLGVSQKEGSKKIKDGESFGENFSLNEGDMAGQNFFPKRYLFQESNIELKFDLVISDEIKSSKKDFKDLSKSSTSEEVSKFLIDTFRVKSRRDYWRETRNNAQLKAKLVCIPPPEFSGLKDTE